DLGIISLCEPATAKFENGIRRRLKPCGCIGFGYFEALMVRSGTLVAGMFVGVVLSILLGPAGTAWPQSTAPPQAPPPGQAQGQVRGQAQGALAPPQSAPGPSAPDENPGLIGEMSKLFQKLPSLPSLKSPGETVDDLNNRAKEAGDTLSRLAKPSAMVSGHEA